MVTLFKVENEALVDVLKEMDPEEEFSGEETRTNHNIVSVNIVNDDSFNVAGAFTKEELNAKNGVMYLVRVIYSVGDSLNTHHSSNVEFLECFLNEEKANKLVENIELHNKLFSKDQSIDEYVKYLENNGIMEKLKNEETFSMNRFKKYVNGQIYYLNEKEEVLRLTVPWGGYFEVLENAYVNLIEVKELNNKSKNKVKV